MVVKSGSDNQCKIRRIHVNMCRIVVLRANVASRTRVHCAADTEGIKEVGIVSIYVIHI